MAMANENIRHLHNVIVFGNGFDLDLGFRTSYKDFMQSGIWRKVCDKNSQAPLAMYLESLRERQNWFDIEEALRRYSLLQNNIYKKDAVKDRLAYNSMCEALMKYLEQLVHDETQCKTVAQRESLAKCFLRNLDHDTESRIYSFNYTSLEELYKDKRVVSRLLDDDVTYMHGSLKQKKIIFGFDEKDLSDVDSDYTFMMKVNSPIYKSSDINDSLIYARNVIFWGHSLNDIDSAYYDVYFHYLLNHRDERHGKTLTIVTKNGASRKEIQDTLGRRGIYVPLLYQSIDLHYIFTDDYKSGSQCDRLLSLIHS